MKKLLLLLLAVISAEYIYSQSGYNQRFALPYPKSHFYDLLVDNDTVIGYGVGFSDSILWKQGVFVAKMDSSGSLLHSVFIQDSLGDKLGLDAHWGKIIKTADGGYAATTATVYRNSAFLIKLDKNLEVEFIKEYPDTVNLSNFRYTPFETPNGYLLYGAIQQTDFVNKGFIRYVDKQGEPIWQIDLLLTASSNVVRGMQRLNDSIYVCSMLNSVEPLSSKTSLHLFNLEGEILDSWQSAVEPDIGYNRNLLVTTDGKIITYGLYLAYIVSNTKFLQSTIAKFNTDFQLEWIRHFGPIKTINAENQLQDFATTLDENIVGVGHTTVRNGLEPSRRHGWVYKFSPETGDSIWMQIFPTPLYDTSYNSGKLFGVGTLSSGSIIAGGEAVNGQTQNAEIWCWLVKLTNDGCLDTLLCLPSSAVPLAPEDQMPGALRVWPNPASDRLTVESAAPLRAVELVDVLGRVVWRQAVGRVRNATVAIPHGLAAGWYTVTATDVEGRIASRRVWKE